MHVRPFTCAVANKAPSVDCLYMMSDLAHRVILDQTVWSCLKNNSQASSNQRMRFSKIFDHSTFRAIHHSNYTHSSGAVHKYHSAPRHNTNSRLLGSNTGSHRVKLPLRVILWRFHDPGSRTLTFSEQPAAMSARIPGFHCIDTKELQQPIRGFFINLKST